jgi:predicted nucleic acid-binding protein
MIPVVDSSVIAQTFVDEPESESALSILSSAKELHAPDLIFAEVANVLWRRWRVGEMGEEQVKKTMGSLGSVLSTVHPLNLLANDANAISLALAERLAIPFVTADRRLLRKTGNPRWRGLIRTIPEIHALLGP